MAKTILKINKKQVKVITKALDLGIDFIHFIRKEGADIEQFLQLLKLCIGSDGKINMNELIKLGASLENIGDSKDQK